MMDLNQLIMAIRKTANGFRIDRRNYSEMADRIIPVCHLRVPRKAQSGPEWDVVRMAESLETDDWLDMAAYCAALNQARAAMASKP